MSIIEASGNNPTLVNLPLMILYNIAQYIQMLSHIFDGFLNRFSYIFQAGARHISLQNIDTQSSPMTASPVPSSRRRLTPPPSMTSPLPLRTAVASSPASESPLAHKVREELSTSPLSSIEYISNDEQVELSKAANGQGGGGAAIHINEDHKKTSDTDVYYRSPKSLPFELYQHCWIYLEEQLCKVP